MNATGEQGNHMYTGTSMRRVGGLTLAGAIAATTFAAAPAQAATQTHGGHGHGQKASHHQHKRPSHRPAAGFRPVHRALADVVAMTSPAKGQVWFVERTGDGRVVLERKDGNRWSAMRLPIRLESGRGVKIHGSAANDVWLTVGGQLWRFDGRRWSRAGLPAGTSATTVYDVPGSEVYVGLAGDTQTQGVYRLNRGRWTSLGRPDDAENDKPYGPTWTPTDLTRTGGQWFATWRARPHSAAEFTESFALENGTWKDLYQSFFIGSGAYNTLGAWLVPTRDTQIVFSTWSPSSGSMPASGYCTQWVKGVREQSCTTRWAVGAAALLPNGNIVVGGNDYQRYEKPLVQGTFGIRTKSGAEKLVAGDPGDKTLAMAVEPGTSMVWAATKQGRTTTIQAWKG